ncbi:MAG: MaoC family dehydratase [Pseudomonadota bacterium]
MTYGKNNPGNFFEDFTVGQVIQHATPRTVTSGDVALYTGFYGSRFAVQSSAEFAKAIGYPDAPIDDLLVFHVVFGKTVPDISINAVANLGYAECCFLKPVYVGDTLSAASEVIGLKENSNGKTGVVYVRSTGFNQSGDAVLTYVRWVMVRKKDPASSAPDTLIPELSDRVDPTQMAAGLPQLDEEQYSFSLAGAPHRFGNYSVGEKIDHVDAMTLEDAEHQIATRLYQNTAKVHFNNFEQSKGRFGARLVYGGVVISLARALSFNGLANAFHVAAINAGQHVAPMFAGGTVFAWSEVLEAAALPDTGLGALRLRTVATRDLPCIDFPYKDGNGAYLDGVILDLDYWVVLPK